LELLEPMTPRHYSIASSSRLTPDWVALVVSVLDAPARSGHGLFQGVASNHLAAIAPGAQVRAGRCSPAGLPGGGRPRQERHPGQRGHRRCPVPRFPRRPPRGQTGRTAVFASAVFLRSADPNVDYIFREQFEAAEVEGIVRMRPAFSRASQDGVRYVQDRIAADADEVWALLGEPAKDTHVYVCGDGAKMAPAVRQAFLDIYRAHTGADESSAREWLIGLVESDHYVEDVWAG